MNKLILYNIVRSNKTPTLRYVFVPENRLDIIKKQEILNLPIQGESLTHSHNFTKLSKDLCTSYIEKVGDFTFFFLSSGILFDEKTITDYVNSDPIFISDHIFNRSGIKQHMDRKKFLNNSTVIFQR